MAYSNVGTRCYPFLKRFRCTSAFGSRSSSESYVSKYHYGLDLVGIEDINVVSCCDGIVRKATNGGGYGNYVWIENSDGSGCIYAHLKNYVVKVGQRVSMKQKIGVMGNTGNSTGPHLHLGVSSNPSYGETHANKSKYFINPALWFGMGSNPKSQIYSGEGLPNGGTYDQTSTNTSTISTISSGLGGLTAILPSGEYYDVKDLKGAYSDWLYGRRYRVFVDLGNNQAFDVSELRCTFSVIKTAYLEANQSILKIYNLNPEDENKLIKQGQRIIIEAGYNGDQYGAIFAGKVIQPIRSKENGVDYILTLVSMDSEIYASWGLVGVSLVAEQSSRDAINAATQKATYKQEVGYLTDSTITYPRGKVLFGNPRNYLDEIARSENATYFSDDGKVNIVSAKDVPQGTILAFGPDSGLIGTPEQTLDGISCKVLLNPRITINSLFYLDNKKITGYQYTQGNPVRSLDQNGIYRVIKLTHVGDTRGSDWYTEIEAISQAGILPGMVASDTIYAY